MKKILLVAAATLLLPAMATAASIGVAVKSGPPPYYDPGPDDLVTGQPSASSSEAADLVNLANTDLGANTVDADDIVGFFIPLKGPNCVFGNNGCGLVSDRGLGSEMDMWLFFEDVDAGIASLSIFYEDLDLLGGSDPNPPSFLESVEIFDVNGGDSIVEVTSLTGNDPSVVTVSGDSGTQRTVSVNLGDLDAGDYFLKLGLTSEVKQSFFSSNSNYNKCKKWHYQDKHNKKHYCPYNTPEFLIAAIETKEPRITTPPVPLPAAAWMLIAGLGGLWAVRRRHNG